MDFHNVNFIDLPESILFKRYLLSPFGQYDFSPGKGLDKTINDYLGKMPAFINITFYTSPVGELIIGSYNNQLCLCDWHHRKMRVGIDARIQKGLNASYIEKTDDITEAALTQLDAYFKGKRREFDLPLKMIGTDFQKSVWSELKKISYGNTKSYLELSRNLGDEKAIRAVASANGANALAIIVPCHRIIGSNGNLIGFAGGLKAKKALLKLEGALVHNQLDLFD